MGISPRRTLRTNMFQEDLAYQDWQVSAGMWAYDKWKNRSINDED